MQNILLQKMQVFTFIHRQGLYNLLQNAKIRKMHCGNPFYGVVYPLYVCNVNQNKKV